MGEASLESFSGKAQLKNHPVHYRFKHILLTSVEYLFSIYASLLFGCREDYVRFAAFWPWICIHVASTSCVHWLRPHATPVSVLYLPGD